MQHSEQSLHGQGGLLTKFQDYLGEFVYGGIDGSVTTFAVVAGASGAGLDSSIVIILGFANLIADGFSMSVGSYLSNKSEKETYEKHKQIEYWEVDHIPHKEREEVEEIYREKGFKGDLLKQIVDHITADKDRWVDIMMKEELELIKPSKSAITMAIMTFISFNIVGFIPLAVYLIDYLNPLKSDLFFISSVLTGAAFIAIGWLKSYVNETNRLRSIFETLLLGTSAAVLAYIAGNYLEKLFA